MAGAARVKAVQRTRDSIAEATRRRARGGRLRRILFGDARLGLVREPGQRLVVTLRFRIKRMHLQRLGL